MAKNDIIKGKNNPVTLVFSGLDLTAFSDISATFGSDTRTLLLNPTSVVVVSATELNLFFNDTSETEGNFWHIFGIDGTHPDGRDITSECLGNLPKTYVCSTSITPDDIKNFCKTAMPDIAIDALICVVEDKMGACAESSYSACVAEQILIYAVCHMIESQKGGSVKSKRAANGAGITIEQYGTGEGIKSTPSGRLLLMIDTEGCYNNLFASPLIFGTVGNAASVL